MFIYNPIFTHREYDIKFDERYLKKRGWSAAVTAPGVLWSKPFNHPLRHSHLVPELLELIDQGADSIDDALTCWLAFNCIGRWDKIGLKKIEFEEECDAVMYKIIFAEYF